MLINPQYAIDQGWITGLTNIAEQLQPNAVDFDIASVSRINNNHFIINADNTKTHRGWTELPTKRISAVSGPARDYFVLEGSTSYDAMSNAYVKLPAGVAATVIIRSTLNRNGLFLTSGLWDSGFEGNIGVIIHNMVDSQAFIEPGTRIGQIIFHSSDSAGLYAGGYNHAEGSKWTEVAANVK